jgi:hypothetical protein
LFKETACFTFFLNNSIFIIIAQDLFVVDTAQEYTNRRPNKVTSEFTPIAFSRTFQLNKVYSFMRGEKSQDTFNSINV